MSLKYAEQYAAMCDLRLQLSMVRTNSLRDRTDRLTLPKSCI